MSSSPCISPESAPVGDPTAPKPFNLTPKTNKKPKFSYPKRKIKVLMLEGLHQNAVELFEAEGYQIVQHAGALSGDELKEAIKDAQLVGVRSKTKLTAEILGCAERLKAIGCFCIGTDQTDLPVAEGMGVPVFNSPFSNSRSVAELVISHVISLARRVPDHIRDMHNNQWNKVSKGCNEVRGKTLGIVGYGHIGTQLGVLAEAMGMRVIFYDVLNIMPLGTARAVPSLDAVLENAHFVTLHVPNTPETQNMMRAEHMAKMKKGSYLLNLSRGKVVDLKALADALNSGHLAGAAVDVYPREPAKNGDMAAYPEVEIPLQGCRNCILTPHIGGSTEEAQAAIGTEVAHKLIKFINLGQTELAVNFPEITPIVFNPGTHRLLHTHRNVPGVLKAINLVLGDLGNIRAQSLRTTQAIGYLVVDVDATVSEELTQRLTELESTIKCRILY